MMITKMFCVAGCREKFLNSVTLSASSLECISLPPRDPDQLQSTTAKFTHSTKLICLTYGLMCCVNLPIML